MIERIIDIEAPPGAMQAFIARPDGDSPFPVVLFYMDAPASARNSTRWPGASRARATTCCCPTSSTASARSASRSATRAMFAHLEKDPAAGKGPVGCIGLCMSGRLVVSAAGTFPERIAAVFSMYGVGIVTGKEDSPHFLVKDIRAECYFGFAESDATVLAHLFRPVRATAGH